jgi:hypothetical protein
MLVERRRPLAPAEAFAPEPDRSWFHDIKDEAMWRIKGDPQWWVKFFCFVIGVLLVALGVAAIF